jgi:hypothetical protein
MRASNLTSGAKHRRERISPIAAQLRSFGASELRSYEDAELRRDVLTWLAKKYPELLNG